jgi:hypothetical protein
MSDGFVLAAARRSSGGPGWLASTRHGVVTPCECAIYGSRGGE